METSKLSYFPAPVDGETVYSWLARFHIWSGHNSFRKHSLALFGIKTGQAAAEFPNFLMPLSQQTGVDIDWIIEHMTDVAFYKSFLNQQQYQSLIDALKEGNTTSLQSKLGMVANRITPGKVIYFCPKCVEKDFEQVGFPYWHVEHQIVGLVSCSIHQVELVSLRKIRSMAILPIEHKAYAVNETVDDFSHLIHDEYRCELVLEKSKIIWTFQTRLKELGLLTSNLQLRLKSIKGLLKIGLMKLSDYPVYQHLLSALERQYPECLFYNESAQHHPIKQLFFIFILFGKWNRFLEYYNAAKPLDNKSLESIPHQNLVLSAPAKKQLESGESLRHVSTSTGISVSTLKILAQQEGISIDTRPQKIFRYVERDIWRKLLMGGSCTDIAKGFDISVGAVEQILRKHQYLKPLRKKIWFHRDQNQHRNQLTQYFSDYPTHTRKQFRSANGAAYAWLYRHDKEWLEENLPEKVKRIYWPRNKAK